MLRTISSAGAKAAEDLWVRIAIKIKAAADVALTAGAVPRKNEQFTANGINGRSFSFKEQGISVPIDTDLVWDISEGTDKMLHPVHLHGCQFRIVQLDGAAPPAHMTGWKDTVPIENAGNAEIYARFPVAAPADLPYMAHCHILEHEGSGMMTESGTIYRIMKTESHSPRYQLSSIDYREEFAFRGILSVSPATIKLARFRSFASMILSTLVR